MKKTFNLLSTLLIFAAVSVFISCGGADDETPAPASPTLNITVSGTATVSGQTITAVPGQSVTFAWNAQTPGGFNVFRIKQGTTTVFERNRTDLSLAAGTTSVQGPSYTFDFTAAHVGTFDIELSVVDDLNKEDKKSYAVTVTSPNARSYTAVLLYVPLESKTAVSFFSSTNGQKYSPTAVTSTNASISPTIDFGYYYGVTDNATLASPLAYSTVPVAAFNTQVVGWTKLNGTLFRRTTLTSAAFIETKTWAQIDAAYNAGTAQAGLMTNLATGQVLAFQTDATKTGGSKRGLILVKGITGTFNQGNNIELEVLVQETVN